MKKDKANDGFRPYRLAHQTLCITGINFETESLIGYVEMQISPLKPDLKRVKLNSKQCCIYRVSINEVWEAEFTYNDPTLELCQGDGKQRNLDYFESSHISAVNSVDPDLGNGELTIRLPTESQTIIQELRPFRICIEFSLERPKGGVKFVVADIDGSMLERAAHLFTCKQENASRLWFPCLDSYSEVCTWKLEFTVDMYLTAVSCGDLIETVYTTDLRKKTYHYYLSTPTAAPNIGLAVGPFEVFVDPHMHEVTHFCLPHLLPLLKHSTSLLHEAFEFYEELLSSRYPYSCYKQVFVDEAYAESVVYATMSIFRTNLLHSKRIIDQVPHSRQVMASAIAQQFFGCFISMFSWFDAWLPKGIAAYLANLYKRKVFGNNEYRHSIAQEMKLVQEYEQSVALIVLDPSTSREADCYFSRRQPHAISSRYAEVFETKAHLVVRMLEMRIGRELMLQVLNKLLSLAINASQQKFTSHNWGNMMLSTSSFLKCITTVTGKDMQSFIEQWVLEGGFAKFNGSFVFNRKRNVLELELKQDWTSKGALKYVGPLVVAIQELDGTFNHNFKIEENKTKFEITCHSKSRRHKKKKIPLSTGEEVDMDLSDTDNDSPVLWLRIDPEMTILRHVQLEQPDWMWQYLLRFERCVVSQQDAIHSLQQFPTPKTRLALTDTIENEKCFYRVRMDAAMKLSHIANLMAASWAGPPAMANIFRKMFGSHSCPMIVRRNNFTNFQHYYLQKTIPQAMARLRSPHGICPPEVLQFLFDLIKYNDNSKNRYSDNYYRAALIDALAATITPAVNTVTITGMGPSTDALTEETKLILEELTRVLNLEKLLPCYKFTTTISCLKAVRHLQKFGHLPIDSSLFRRYASSGTFFEVRLAALENLVDFTRVESCKETFDWLIKIVETDPEPFIRHRVLQMLISDPPFTRHSSSPLSTEDIVERLWVLMNSGFAHDSRLRCDVADLYYTLFGRTRPPCLPIPESLIVLNLKERRMVTSHSMSDLMEHDQDSHGGEAKRRPESPLGSQRPSKEARMSSMYDSAQDVEEGEDGENSQFRLKIKFGAGKSFDSSSVSEVQSPPKTYMSFNDEFSKYATKIPSPSHAPGHIFSPEKAPSPDLPLSEDDRNLDHSPSRLSASSVESFNHTTAHTEEVVEEIILTGEVPLSGNEHVSDSDSNAFVPEDVNMISQSYSASDQKSYVSGYPGSQSPGQSSYNPGSPGQHAFTPGSPGQRSFTPGSPGQRSFTPGSPGQRSFTPGSPGQHSYTPASPGQRSFTPGSPGLSRDAPSRSPSMMRASGLPPHLMEYQGPSTDDVSPAGSFTPSDVTPSGSEPLSKSSKVKKKKKKNKHKHKHKHKHDKAERDRDRERPLMDWPSSEASTHSPAVMSQQSSPDFEVI